MTVAATESAIDAAYWLFQRAEKENRFLEDDKAQHLLFLAQTEFVKKHHSEMLLPCLFVCGENGFFEPNLAKIFSFGRPFMPPVTLPDKAHAFLEGIWKKYASTSTEELEFKIKNSPIYKETYIKGKKNTISAEDIAKYGDVPSAPSVKEKKILLSQNGPVVVSSWNPRKL